MNTLTATLSSFSDEKTTAKMSVAEFLAYLERYPNQRAELINGQVVAMAGGTLNHSLIASNCLDVKFFLRQHKPCCRVCNSDFGIQTKENQIRYPDFSIVCNIKGSDKIAKDPIVVGEVLSEKSTALFDQTEKLAEYKNVHAIQEIFLISQTQKEIVVHRRGKFFGWETEVYTQGQVQFASIGYEVDIDDIYAEVEFV